jgi:hypothetical protein
MSLARCHVDHSRRRVAGRGEAQARALAAMRDAGRASESRVAGWGSGTGPGLVPLHCLRRDRSGGSPCASITFLVHAAGARRAYDNKLQRLPPHTAVSLQLSPLEVIQVLVDEGPTLRTRCWKRTAAAFCRFTLPADSVRPIVLGGDPAPCQGVPAGASGAQPERQTTGAALQHCGVGRYQGCGRVPCRRRSSRPFAQEGRGLCRVAVLVAGCCRRTLRRGGGSLALPIVQCLYSLIPAGDPRAVRCRWRRRRRQRQWGTPPAPRGGGKQQFRGNSRVPRRNVAASPMREIVVARGWWGTPAAPCRQTRIPPREGRGVPHREAPVGLAGSRRGQWIYLPLHRAATAESESAAALRVLVKLCPRALRKRDKQGRGCHCTRLRAVRRPTRKKVGCLLEAWPWALHERDVKGQRPLHLAVERGGRGVARP